MVRLTDPHGITSAVYHGHKARNQTNKRRSIAIFLESYEPRSEKTGLRGFPTRSDTNQAVQPQKMVRGSKFWI